MRVSEIRVNQIRVNQGLGVIQKKILCPTKKNLSFWPNLKVEVWPNRTFGRSLEYRQI